MSVRAPFLGTAARLPLGAAVVLLAVTVGSEAEEAPARVTVRPADHGRALVNPGMGFVLHYYDNSLERYGSRLDPSDALEDWPGLSTVYLRLAWSYLEPEEGRFDWSLVDGPAQRWIARGKNVAFRFSASEGRPGVGTPAWVRAAGAKGYSASGARATRSGARRGATRPRPCPGTSSSGASTSAGRSSPRTTTSPTTAAATAGSPAPSSWACRCATTASSSSVPRSRTGARRWRSASGRPRP